MEAIPAVISEDFAENHKKYEKITLNRREPSSKYIKSAFNRNYLGKYAPQIPKPMLYYPDLNSKYEKVTMLKDGGRSATILLPINVNLELIGINEPNSVHEFMLCAKGCLPESNLASGWNSAKYPKIHGGERLETCDYAVEITKTLTHLNKHENLNLKFAPTLYSIKLPQEFLERIFEELSNDEAIALDREPHGIELRLMPSTLRADNLCNSHHPNFPIAVDNGLINPSQLLANLWKDFQTALETIPKTIGKLCDPRQYISIGDNGGWFFLAKDLVLSNAGSWFVDLESVAINSIEDNEITHAYLNSLLKDYLQLIYNIKKLGDITEEPSQQQYNLDIGYNLLEKEFYMEAANRISKSKLIEIKYDNDRLNLTISLSNIHKNMSGSFYLHQYHENKGQLTIW